VARVHNAPGAAPAGVGEARPRPPAVPAPRPAPAGARKRFVSCSFHLCRWPIPTGGRPLPTLPGRPLPRPSWPARNRPPAPRPNPPAARPSAAWGSASASSAGRRLTCPGWPWPPRRAGPGPGPAAELVRVHCAGDPSTRTSWTPPSPHSAASGRAGCRRFGAGAAAFRRVSGVYSSAGQIRVAVPTGWGAGRRAGRGARRAGTGAAAQAGPGRRARRAAGGSPAPGFSPAGGGAPPRDVPPHPAGAYVPPRPACLGNARPSRWRLRAAPPRWRLHARPGARARGTRLPPPFAGGGRPIPLAQVRRVPRREVR